MQEEEGDEAMRTCENCKFYQPKRNDNRCTWESATIPTAWVIDLDVKFVYLGRTYADCAAWEARSDDIR